MPRLTVFGIPTCGTVKKARRWLAAAGLAHDWVDIRATPPGLERIRDWIQVLGCPPLRNTSGRAYRSLPDSRKQWTDAEWARAFAKDPMLIRRPVVELDSAPVLVGFRPDVWKLKLSGLQDNHVLLN